MIYSICLVLQIIKSYIWSQYLQIFISRLLYSECCFYWNNSTNLTRTSQNMGSFLAKSTTRVMAGVIILVNWLKASISTLFSSAGFVMEPWPKSSGWKIKQNSLKRSPSYKNHTVQWHYTALHRSLNKRKINRRIKGITSKRPEVFLWNK